MPDFPDGLFYQDHLPLTWLDAPVQSALEAQRYLEVLEAMEQRPHDGTELSSVEARLDLQLLWLARLLTPQRPPECSAEIGITHIRWTQPDMLELGRSGYVGLMPGASLPYLLSLPATIASAQSHDGVVQLLATWSWPTQSLNDAFARTVFRRHRAQIRHYRGVVS